MGMIYLVDDVESTIKRILSDDELKGLGLNRTKVRRTLTSFGGDEIAASVFLKKYALRDGEGQIAELTLEEAKSRWALAIAESESLFDGERKDPAYFRELYDHFLPAGRQMFALGNKGVSNITYTNCYVTQIEDDSIEGIYGAAQKLARTYSYGGGIGLCVGELRPRGARVSNSARQSTGSVSFMELFSLTTGLIGQAGRRGALMITLPVSHPDAEEFIKIKHGNTDKVKYANISLKLTDEFMRAVIEDKVFRQTYSTKHETIWREVRARDLWQKIIQNARDSAEPGLMFWDRMVAMSPSEIYPKLRVHSTNPCVTRDSWIHTAAGPQQVVGLVGRRSFVARVNGRDNRAIGFFSTGVKPVYRLTTKEGYSLRLTIDHMLRLVVSMSRSRVKSVWKKLGELKRGDLLALSNQSSAPEWSGRFTEQEGYLVGLLFGDGSLSNQKAVLSIWDKDEGSCGIAKAAEEAIRVFPVRSDFAGWAPVSGRAESRMAVASFSRFIHDLGIDGSKRIVPEIEATSSDFHKGFLRGFFDTDGSVQGDHDKGVSVRLSQSDLERLQAVQRMLLRLGIASTIYQNRRLPAATTMPDGKGGQKEYRTKAQHELVIANDNMYRFRNLIGFNHLAKKQRLDETLSSYKRAFNRERFVATVEEIEFDGEEEVFDTCVENVHAFDANGLCAHNCGEQILEKGGACVLGSLLLHTFVVDPFTPQARFDFDLFRQMTRRAVRHLDNVVELNFGRHALAEQEEAARLGRRIGLGVTGLADALAAMGVRYDSEEALQVVDQIMSVKKDAEYRASMDLALVRGPFQLFDAEGHYERGFCATLPEELKELGRKQGQRNVAVSTVAPAGSLSVIAQCSSGIEPIFALRYKRYVELGTERKEFAIRHQGLSRMAAVTGDENAPWCWVTAHSIDHRFRVAMQGIIQRHTDASISSTINLPKDATPEMVGEIYMDAWRGGLKGITVYREGSREGILVTEEFARQAGSPMDTIIYEARAEAGDKFYIPISYERGDVRRPYQVFLINYKTSENDRFVKIGNDLVRMLREHGVDDSRIQKYLDRSSTQLSKLTRFLSLSMKTGNFSEAVAILGQHGTVGTLAAELYKILSRSLAVKTVVCRNPNCGSSNVRMEESCMHCLDCGWSGCG